MELLGFWTYLLMRANHKDAYCRDGLLIRRGTFKTGRKQISLETGLSESKSERFLKRLEIEQQIEQQKTSKYRIITITNWLKWQGCEQQIEQQVNNRRTTSEQQMDTNKNDKNKNNEKEGEEVVLHQQKMPDKLSITEECVRKTWLDLTGAHLAFNLTRTQLNKLIALNLVMDLEKYKQAIERLKIDPFFLKAENKSVDMILSDEILLRVFQKENQIDLRQRMITDED